MQVAKIAERSLISQMSQNLKRSNDQIRILLLFLSLPKNNDIKRCPIIAHRNEMHNVISPNEDKLIQLHKKDDRVYDILEPNNY